jgi:hypothetical protein
MLYIYIGIYMYLYIYGYTWHEKGDELMGCSKDAGLAAVVEADG